MLHLLSLPPSPSITCADACHFALTYQATGGQALSGLKRPWGFVPVLGQPKIGGALTTGKCQVDAINYCRENWVHADLTREEFVDCMERGKRSQLGND